MYLIFFLINIFINVFLNNVLDLMFLGINKISQSLQWIESYLMSQNNNYESLEVNNVKSNTVELSWSFNLYEGILNNYNLYDIILNNYEFNQLVNKSNYLNMA